jgi:SAM-dependent methyltransferase
MQILKSIAKRIIGHDRVPHIRSAIKRCIHFGFGRFCPCCEARIRRFGPYGHIKRREAKCPVCGSLERHRFIWLYMTRKTDLFDGNYKKMLHVAPEPELSRLIQKANFINYLSADLSDPYAMVKMDVTDIQYPDNTFDVIYCSHVLEHIPDDRQAMREFYRVLKPGRWAILNVPITANRTFEDPSVIDPKERERLFGQFDHVRRYGPDYKDRVMEAGFSVTVDPFVRELESRTARRFGLMREENVYFCRKQGA